MKFLNTEYDYFVEIQIWRMKYVNGLYLYRYCYANDSPFWKNMDISMEEKSKLGQNWKLYQTFFAFSNARLIKFVVILFLILFLIYFCLYEHLHNY